MATKDDALRLLREGQSHQFAEPPDYVAVEKAYRTASEERSKLGRALPPACVYSRATRLTRGSGRYAYLRAIQLLPNDPRPLIAFGGLQHRLGQYAKAIQSIQAGLALKPHYAEADARLMLAEAFASANNLTQAATQ